MRFINKNFQFSVYFCCFYWGSSLSMLEFNCSALDFFVGKSHGASDAETISFGTTQKLCLGFAVVLVFVGRDYQKWVPSLLGSVPPAARGWDLSSNQAFLGCLGYSKQKWIFPNCSAVWVTCPCIIEGSVMASKQHRTCFLARKRHAWSQCIAWGSQCWKEIKDFQGSLQASIEIPRLGGWFGHLSRQDLLPEEPGSVQEASLQVPVHFPAALHNHSMSRSTERELPSVVLWGGWEAGVNVQLLVQHSLRAVFFRVTLLRDFLGKTWDEILFMVVKTKSPQPGCCCCNFSFFQQFLPVGQEPVSLGERPRTNSSSFCLQDLALVPGTKKKGWHWTRPSL